MLAALVSLVLLLLVSFTAHIPVVRQYVAQYGRDYLRASQNLDLEVSSLDYNIFTLSATLRGVRLQSGDVPDLPPALTAREIYLNLRFADLARGQFAIQDGHIEGLDLRIVTDGQGRSNLPRSPTDGRQPQAPTKGLPLFIESFSIRGASIDFEDKKQEIHVEIPQWNLTIRGNRTNHEHTLLLTANPTGYAALHGRRLPLRNLNLDLLLQPDNLLVRKAQVESENSQLSMAGRLSEFSHPKFDLNVSARLDLGKLVKWAGIEQEIEGQVNLQAKVQDTIDNLQIAGDLSGENLNYGEFRNVSLHAAPTWDAGSKRILLEELRLHSSAGSLQGRATLALEPAAGESDLQARFENWDLQKVGRQLEQGYQITSRASGQIDLRWSGLDFKQPTGKANVRLTSFSEQTGANLLPLSGSLSLNAQGRRVALSVTSLRALGAQVSGEIVLDTLSSLSGTVQGDIPTLARTVSELEGFTGKLPGEFAGMEPDGSLSFRANLAGSIENPEVSLLVQGKDLQIGEDLRAALDVEARYKAKRFNVGRADIRWHDQTFSTSGSVGLEQDTPTLDLDVNAPRISIGTLVAGLGSSAPVDGHVGFSAHIGGSSDNPSAILTATASDLTVYGEVLGRLQAEATLANQQIQLSRLVLKKSREQGESGYLRAAGTVDLKTRQYSVSATSEDLFLENLTLPGNILLRGSLDIAAQGTGTLDNPTLAFSVGSTDLLLDNRPFGEIALTAHVEQQQAILSLQAPLLNLAGNARIHIETPYTAEFEVVAKESDLSSLAMPTVGGESLKGVLSGNIRGAIDLADWQRGNGETTVTNLRLSLGEQEIRNEGPLKVGFREGVLRFEPGRLVSGKSTLNIAGSLPFDRSAGPGELGIQAELDPEGLLCFIPQAQKWRASGDVLINATLRGTLRSLEPSLRLDVRDGFFSIPHTGVPLRDLQVSARTRANSLVLESASANWASGHISIQGSLPLGLLASTGLPLQEHPIIEPARLRLRLEDLRLEATGLLPEDLTGRISLQVEAEAPRLELGALTATARLDNLNVNASEFEIRQAAPGMFSLRDGVARIEQFTLIGPQTNLQLAGSASVVEPQTLGLTMEGETDIGLMALFTKTVQASGEGQIRLALGGTWQDPRLSGQVELKQGKVALTAPPLLAEQLNGQMEITSDRLALNNLTGVLNGGELRASATVGYSGTELKEVAADLVLQNVFLNFPEGLRTASQAELRIATQGQEFFVGGEVRILEGSFREPLDIESEVMAFLQSGRTIEIVEEQRSPLLSRLRYNLPIRTDGPIVVDNNLAKLTATANLRLVGTYYRPSLTGRLSLEEGGALYLGENTYAIDTGRVDFVNENRIEPSVNLVARTRAGGRDIELRVAGEPEDLETTLTSDPPLPEPDIISVLLTGRTLEEARGSGINVAKEQGLSYLTGRVGERFSRRAQEGLGLSQVRIEPNLIASESDPSVRLTLGQDLSRDLRLIYSMNLADSGDQIYKTEYRIGRRFNASGVKQSDNSYRFGFRHDLQLGGLSAPSGQKASSKRVIGKIAIAGQPALEEKELIGKLGIKPGDTYDFFELQRGVHRLEDFYRKQGRLESRVRLQQEKTEQIVNLTLDADAGPNVEFIFEGIDLPGSLKRQVAENWQRGVFEAQRVQDALDTIRRWLVRSDYLQQQIRHESESLSPDLKREHFYIEAGVQYRNKEIAFEGSSAFSPSRLKGTLEDFDVLAAICLDPARVVEVLSNFYHRQGYLDATVAPPHCELQPENQTAVIVIPVAEGRLYRFGQTVFEGSRAVSSEQLQEAIPLTVGLAYSPEILETSVDELEELYWANGYNKVVINFMTRRIPSLQEVNITFQITENQQDRIESIGVKGNSVISEAFLRKRLPFSEGAIFDFTQAARARKNLYQTGAFTFVDFETEPVPGATAEFEDRLRVSLNVGEVRPYQLRYGGYYDTDRGPGGILDFENRNTLGDARLLGVRTRYDSDLREVRGYFGQQLYWGTSTTLNATGFRRREIVQREFTSDFITDRTGFSIQQEFQPRENWIFNYGYRFERTRTFDREVDPNCPFPLDDPFCRFDITFDIAPLSSSISWDTRDDLLDATRGHFTSHAVEFAPATLGSDLRFLKYFGQLFQYVPLGVPTDVPFGKGQKKSRKVYAAGLRVGLGRGFGEQGLIFSERFFAGGGTTIRGFEQNTVGPKDFLGDTDGGEALFILNQELRYPLVSIFDGVGFLDIGNTYEKVRDFSFWDVRKSAGVGVRVRTPYFLLRLDYGFKLDRKPGEAAGKFFFSIGQAF